MNCSKEIRLRFLSYYTLKQIFNLINISTLWLKKRDVVSKQESSNKLNILDKKT